MSPRFTSTALRLGLAIGVAVAISPATAGASSARITAGDLAALMAKSLAGVQSFQVVNDSRSTHATASPGGVMKLHMVMVFVRQGKALTLSVQSTTDGKQSTMVYTGTRLCVQRGAHATWNCNLPVSYAKGFQANMDPIQAMKDSGTKMTAIAALGAKIILGQSCDGYSFTSTLQSIKYQGHGSIWFSSSTGRLVEVTSVGSMALSSGSAAMVTTGTVVYSRWNDPSLKIAAIPAS